MEKNWNGDQNSIFKTMGASSHAEGARSNTDFYATPPEAVEMLLELENFQNPIWECACGAGHISEVLRNHGFKVRSTDKYNHGFGKKKDFLDPMVTLWTGDVITNPPYKYAQDFVEKALGIIPTGRKVAMFLKILFLEGKRRKKLFLSQPPKVVYVSSSRLRCAKNGDFSVSNSAVAYGWFVWIKGFDGEPILKWFN